MTSPFGSPLEQPCPTATARRRFSIGLPACNSVNEKRFPLTPEGVRMLIDRGYRVIIEADAAAPIHYSDNAYARQGAMIADRASALATDIVIHLAPLSVSDISGMRRGAMLLSLLHADTLSRDTVAALLRRGIVSIAIDLIEDSRGNHPFADILAEIDGRAAIATASSLLADSRTGKGILLGGVAGIVPCEVTVIGSGIAATAAARSAIGLGATVRMFDNDVYSLRAAVRDLGPQVIGSAFHPKVVCSALASADVVIVTGGYPDHTVLGADIVASMKKGVLTFDLTSSPGTLFPSLPTVDLAAARPADNTLCGNRVLYVNAGSAVPRTAAMALSNTFSTLLEDIVVLDGITNALKLTPGLRQGVVTFLGKLTNRRVASLVNARVVDINIFLPLI